MWEKLKLWPYQDLDDISRRAHKGTVQRKVVNRKLLFAGLSMAGRQLCVNNQADTNFNLALAYLFKHVYDKTIYNIIFQRVPRRYFFVTHLLAPPFITAFEIVSAPFTNRIQRDDI